MSTFLYLKPEEDTISMAMVDPEFPEVSIPGQGDMVLVSDVSFLVPIIFHKVFFFFWHFFSFQWPVEAWSKPEKKNLLFNHQYNTKDMVSLRPSKALIILASLYR